MWTKRQIIDSDGHITETKLYYPDDVVNVNSLPGEALTTTDYNAINVLKSQSRKNIPIQTDNKENGQLLSTRTIYRDWKASANGGRIVEPQFIKTLKGVYHATTNPYQLRTTFYDYDTYGNPLEVGQSSGPPTSYLWGYGNQLPVAKVDNATYSQLTGTGIVLGTINSASTNDQTMRNELNKLRTLSNSFATTYTYAPLIGLTSETDPTGYTTFYDYDDFNRLKYIKNKDSKVLKSFAYNYKTDLPQYTVTSTTNGNGTVVLSATVVNQGESVTVTVSPNSGYQISTIKVNGVTQSNTSPFTLTNITSNTVIDVQFSAVAAFTVTPSNITFEFIAEPVTITVGASGNWTVSKSASWITISATSGSGNGSFNVSALKNTGSERTGTVTVTQGSTVKTIAILQHEGI
jgi:YD repeat-containing protein